MIVIVAAHNEADRIAQTLRALRQAFQGASLWVADDGSTDATAAIARSAGAAVCGAGMRIGKGGAMTRAVRRALAVAPCASGAGAGGGESIVLLCDGDLGASAGRLEALVESVRGGEVDLAVAHFSQRVGGGFGLVLGVARRAVRRRGLRMRAPLSGQRAVRAGLLAQLLPFAHGYGMEVGMDIDALAVGCRPLELELDLAHRALGRSPAGFAHRARQLIDVVRADRARR